MAVSPNCDAPGGSSLLRTVFKGALQSTSWPEKRMVFRPGASKLPANDLLTTQSPLSARPTAGLCLLCGSTPPCLHASLEEEATSDQLSKAVSFLLSQPFRESTTQQAALSSRTHLLLYPEGYAVTEADARGLDRARPVRGLC